MLNLFDPNHYLRRWIHLLVLFLITLGLVVGLSPRSQAFSLLDFLRHGVQIIQLSNLSERQEVALGKQINAQLMRGQVRAYRDRALERYVDGIGQQLAANSTRPKLPYTFQIVNDASVNAFATLGGYVYVHTGLLTAADNEAELASVLAHEIGHIEGKHLIKQMRQRAMASGAAAAAGLDENTLTAIGVELAIHRPRSRRDEYEADTLGLTTLGRSGYAQYPMVTFMQKLLQAHSPPTFLSTHPDTTDRIERLEAELDPAQARQGHGLDEAAYKQHLRRLRSQAPIWFKPTSFMALKPRGLSTQG